MYRTPTTSGAAKKPSSTTPSPTTTGTAVQDSARTFIKRPQATRRSLDNMDLFQKQKQDYAELSSDQLLQGIMRTFEDIPSKVHDYPQMRRDIKTFLEVQSDKGIRAIFELSRRIQKYEQEVPKSKTPTRAPSSEGHDDVLRRLGEMEAALTERLNGLEQGLKTDLAKLDERNDDRGANLTDTIFDKIDEVRAAIDQTTEEVGGRHYALLKDLVGGVAGDVAAANEELVEAAKRLTSGAGLAPPPRTYASVAAAAKPVQRPALHSMAVTLEGGQETADEVLARVRRVVNARGTGLKISKVRKAKNQTIILGCDSREESERVREKIESSGTGLKVAPMMNKNPLVVLKDVFTDSEDEDIVMALHTQNKEIFEGLPEEDREIVIKYKKRTRNPHTTHIILQVRPKTWQRMTETGALYLDLQRVRVEDQSPLIQCTKCLAFGHGRKFCTESVDRCSHCGGPHLREKCAENIAGNEPQCCNCSRSGLRRTDHNAFNADCPVRLKWDYLARANTAYA